MVDIGYFLQVTELNMRGLQDDSTVLPILVVETTHIEFY